MRLPLVLVVFAAGCHPVRTVPDPDAPVVAHVDGDGIIGRLVALPTPPAAYPPAAASAAR